MSSCPTARIQAGLLDLYQAFEACQPMITRSGLDPTETEIQVTRLLLRSVERVLGGHPIKDALSWVIRCLRRLLGRVRNTRRLIASSEISRLPAPDPGDPFAVGFCDMWLWLEEMSVELAELLSPVELRCVWAARDAGATQEAAERAGIGAAHFRDAFRRALGKITWIEQTRPCLAAGGSWAAVGSGSATLDRGKGGRT